MAGQPSNDELFAAALKDTPSVLSVALGDGASTTFQEKAGFAFGGDDPRPFLLEFKGATHNLPELENAARGIGAFNWVADRDQIVRRVALMFRLNEISCPPSQRKHFALPRGRQPICLRRQMRAARRLSGNRQASTTSVSGTSKCPQMERERYISSSGISRRLHIFPPGRCWLGRSRKRISRAGSCLSAPALRACSTYGRPQSMRPCPAIDIQAQVVETLLTGRFLERPDYALALEELVILVLGVMLAFVLPRVSASASAAIGFLTIGLILIGGWAAFRYGNLLLDPSYPVLVLGSLTAIITFYTYHNAEAQRSQIRHAFGQYLAPALVEQLAQTPEKLVLGGEERDMTILFSDVRGFTAISELYKDDPQGLTSLMHRLLTPLTNAIVGQEGTIDKYIGDAVMGFWNAPLTVPEHELKACAAALDMIDRLAVLNRERQEEAKAAGQPFLPFRIGIGINTGRCLVGNLGSDLRFNYSVLGDPVNVASRLEGQTKLYGVPIIIGSKTGEKAKEKFAILEIDLVTVKGKTESEAIYTLLGREEVASDIRFQELRKLWSTMIYCYRSRDWEGALEAIDLCRSAENNFGLGMLFDLYSTRIQAFQASAPPADWTGIFVAETK